MTDYKSIVGKGIKSLTTNPDNDQAEGQIWYNSTDGVFRDVIIGEAWSSGGPLGTARYALGAAGTQNAGLGFGGASPPSPGFATKTATEEYNGSGWATGGSLGTARYYIGGC